MLDVGLPGIDGFEVCRRLKQDDHTRDIPVIFITAEHMTESVVTGFDVGGVDYIIKPFQNEEVLARVQTHLQLDRLTRELVRKNAELDRANRQIQVASERKSRFLTNMTHELRTPMNAIIGFTRMVLRREGDRLSDRQRDNLSKVTHSADHLLDLINDLLDLAKIEAGRMDITPEPFDIQTLVAACCDEITPLVKLDVSLTCKTDPQTETAHTDPGRVRQVLMNLLSNAAKFTDTGAITVQAARDNDTMVLSISDTGCGIPADALEAIFEEFQQVSGSDPQRKGTGLGLSITKGFVERLGGTIAVESEVGTGSTFTVRLPATLNLNLEENAPLVIVWIRKGDRNDQTIFDLCLPPGLDAGLGNRPGAPHRYRQSDR